MILKTKDGWVVASEKGKPLSRPYQTRAEAEKRLAQIEYFKRKEGNNNG